MIYKVKKGRHRARPLRLGLWFNKKIIRKKVTFTNASKYPFSEISVHKLFGISYLLSPHKDSARFGWRWSGEVFNLYAYVYVHGKRSVQKVCSVPVDAIVNCEIHIVNSSYVFRASYNSSTINMVTVPFTHNKKISYPLNLFYGGKRKAPNDISVKIE